MKVVLVFPPAYYPWFIPPGLGYLTAFLRQQSEAHHLEVEVIQRDANIGSIEYLLRPEHLQEIGADEEAVRTISQSIEAMRDEEKYHQFKCFRYYKAIIERASQYVNATTDDQFLIFRNTLQYVSQYEARQREGVLKAIQDRENNLFYPYFQSVEVEAILNERPDLVGMSVSDHHQLVPAFILASLLKEKAPHVKICLGGNLLARIESTLKRDEPLNQKLFQYVDFMIHHEGEVPLLALVMALDSYHRYQEFNLSILDTVPNMLWFDGYHIRSNTFVSKPTDLDRLPPPAFDGYRPWTPKPVIPLNIYRGCYYSGKCTFCDINAGYDTHHHLERADFSRPIGRRLRDLDLVVEDIKFLQQEYGTQFFSFTDEWFLVEHMEEFVERLHEEKLVGRGDGHDIQWEAYARFEPRYTRRGVCQQLARGGCRFLQFGLESMSVATLRRMRKGNRPANYHLTLENCHHEGIWTHVFLLLGYPGEAMHDVLPLFSFLRENSHLVTTIKPSRFQLTRRSPLAYNPPQEIELPLSEEEWNLYINLQFHYKCRYWCLQCHDFMDHNKARSRKGYWLCGDCKSRLEVRYPYGSSKVVEAMYTVAEKICEMHPYHRVTSVYPYVARLFLSNDELEAFGQIAEPVSIVSEEDLRQTLRKVRNALEREREMIPAIGQVYRTCGLSVPDEFGTLECFLSFCKRYRDAASGDMSEEKGG